MALFFERATNTRELRTRRGEFTLWTLTPTTYVTRFSGHLEDEHVDLLIAYSEPLLRGTKDPLEVFHEWTEMTGYEASCRRRITEWALRNRARFARVHVSTQSKLVAMGVQVANLALRNITSYPSVPALQVALRATLRASGQDADAPTSVRPRARRASQDD